MEHFAGLDLNKGNLNNNRNQGHHHQNQDVVDPRESRDLDERILAHINIEAPTFDGQDPKDLVTWLFTMDNFFDWYNFPNNKRKVMFATMKLIGRAQTFWMYTQQLRANRNQPPITDWVEMKEKLREEYLPSWYKAMLLDEWNSLTQGNKPVTEYMDQFDEYMLICDVVEDERMILIRFRNGLNRELKRELILSQFTTLAQAYATVRSYEWAKKFELARTNNTHHR